MLKTRGVVGEMMRQPKLELNPSKELLARATAMRLLRPEWVTKIDAGGKIITAVRIEKILVAVEFDDYKKTGLRL